MNKYHNIVTDRKFITAFLAEEINQIHDRLATMREIGIKSRDLRWREEHDYLQGMTYRLFWVNSLSPSYTRIAL